MKDPKSMERIWRRMIQRCHNPSASDFAYYGGRGIKVCNQWRESFDCFALDMGDRPSKDYSIERINNDGDYHPLNCKWATRSEQQQNTRHNKFVELNGEKLCLAEAARRSGIPISCLHSRIRRNQPLFEPSTIQKQFLTINGVTKRLAEWGRERGIRYITIWQRVKRGWPDSEVLKQS